MINKVLLAVLGLSFAIFVSTNEDELAKKAKKRILGLQQEQDLPLEKERHHSKW